MRHEIIVPMYADGATKIKLRQWLVEQGNKVEKGDNIAEATTDKIAIFIEAPASGIVEELSAEEGDEVLVGQVIGVITE